MELDRFLDDSGYRAVWLRRDGPVVARSVLGDETHSDLNYLFVPTERCDEVFALLDLTG